MRDVRKADPVARKQAVLWVAIVALAGALLIGGFVALTVLKPAR
jgi:phosphate/sulfate permease